MKPNSNSVAHLITALSVGVFAVGVQFKTDQGQPYGKIYTYKSKQKLEEGDEVVIDSPFTGMTVGVVVSVKDILEIDLEASYSYKWIVSVIDKEAWEKVKEEDAKIESEIQALQVKVKKAKMVEELKSALSLDDNSELDDLIARLTK